jgi:hypothetical protein
VSHGIAKIPPPAACGYRIDATVHYACVGSLGTVRRSTARERPCNDVCSFVRFESSCRFPNKNES